MRKSTLYTMIPSLRKAAAGALMTAMTASQIITPAFAAAKAPEVEETLYINMDAYGTSEKANIVKGISFNGSETYTDYGNYLDVINMSSVDQPEMSDGSVTFHAPKNDGQFFFQGNLDPNTVELPWNLDVSYKLNGVPANAEDLGGASGLIEISIKAEPNEKASEYMKNNMVLVAAVPVDRTKVYSLDAPDSQTVNLGTMSGVGFEALPGKSGDFVVRLGTDKFESGGVIFIMTPVTVGDIREVKDIKEIKDKFRKSTSDAMDSVENVMDDLISFSEQLSLTKGMLEDLQNGKSKIDQSRPIILNGVDVSIQDVKNLVGVLDPLDGSIKTLQWMIYDVNNTLNDTNNDLASCSTQLGYLSTKLKNLSSSMSGGGSVDMQDLSDTAASLEALKASLNGGKTAANYIAAITGNGAVLATASQAAYNSAIELTEYEEEYMPEAVIEVINGLIKQNSAAGASVSEQTLNAMVPSIAAILGLHSILSDPFETGKRVYTVKKSDLQTMAGSDAAAKNALITNFVTTAVTDAIVNHSIAPTDQQTASAQIIGRFQKVGAGSVSGESTERAKRFAGRMASLLKLQSTAKGLMSSSATLGGTTLTLSDSTGLLLQSMMQALSDGTDAFSSVDYEELISQIDVVLGHIDDISDDGSAVAFQTAKVVNALRNATSDIDKLVSLMNTYYEDIQNAMSSASTAIEQSEKLLDDVANTMQICNDTIRAVSKDLSSAADKGIEAGKQAVDNADEMLTDMKDMKTSFQNARKSVSDELDEIEEESNVLNMDPDAVKPSFTSTKNQEPTSVQIVCRTLEIKAEDNVEKSKNNSLEDAEFAEEPLTFKDRIVNMFKAVGDKFNSLFKK